MLTIPLLAAPWGLAACSSRTSTGSASGGAALAPAALCQQPLDRLIAADQSNGTDKSAWTVMKQTDRAIDKACPGAAP